MKNSKKECKPLQTKERVPKRKEYPKTKEYFFVYLKACEKI